MRINNKNGHVYFGGLIIAPAHVPALVTTVAAFKAAWIVIILACAWHVPAWEKAKANHTEAQYQKQEMWPQQLFDKLPGGTPGRSVGSPVVGNGGNFVGGSSN